MTVDNRAVVNRRETGKDSLDFFPTPPWATRALVHHVVPYRSILRHMSALDPCAGIGHMAEPLKEYFASVKAFDIVDRGYPLDKVGDYLEIPSVDIGWNDWVIMNPPFKLAEEFIIKAVYSQSNVAALVRTSFLEGAGRYSRLFSELAPDIVAQFSERVPMVKDRYDPKASTATSYCWMVWAGLCDGTKFVWIPPCRKELEKPEDINIGVKG